MKTWMRALALVTGVVAAVFVSMMVLAIVLSEVGEVVLIETAQPDGSTRTTRIWIVDAPDGPRVRGAGGTPWVDGARRVPEVKVSRRGTVTAYRAVELKDPADHERVRVWMREKYGVADQLIDAVRNLDRVAIFRLDPAENP